MHLALGDRCRRARQDVQHGERSVGHHQLEGAREQEVAHQDGSLVAEHGVGAGEAPAKQAFVDHVVVQQRRRVDELDAGGQVDVAVALVAAHAGRRQRQQRPQPLAAGGDDVRRELRDQGDRAVHPRDDGAVAGLQVRPDQLDQPGQRVPFRHRRCDGRLLWRPGGAGLNGAGNVRQTGLPRGTSATAADEKAAPLLRQHAPCGRLSTISACQKTGQAGGQRPRHTPYRNRKPG